MPTAAPSAPSALSLARILPDQLLTSRDVARRLSISVRTLFRLVRAGKFPDPIRYNRRLIRWKSEAVVQYIQHL